MPLSQVIDRARVHHTICHTRRMAAATLTTVVGFDGTGIRSVEPGCPALTKPARIQAMRIGHDELTLSGMDLGGRSERLQPRWHF
ncbi:hypothetical protein [Paracoccus sp. Ld10]|uniref:hypothetical protein n=1 Tax=Paracoccus sp. Ld10 TaxID=649158 RepID=UPI003862F81C